MQNMFLTHNNNEKTIQVYKVYLAKHDMKTLFAGYIYTLSQIVHNYTTL